MNAACSSQNDCSRVPFDKSGLGPGEEIVTNVCFIQAIPLVSLITATIPDFLIQVALEEGDCSPPNPAESYGQG